MSLTTQINGGFVRVGTEFKTVRSEMAALVGSLGDLDTTDKSDIVSAINEVLAASGGTPIADLDDLLDVVITSVANGHVLKYDSTSSKWINVLGTSLFDAAGTASSAVAALSSVYQPLDSDLTSIAALATTSYGRAFLTLANQAALLALLPAASTTQVGVARLATTTEATTGTDATIAVTPQGLKAGLDALVNASPSTLDTLKELADALGDDPDFATTMSTALGNRVRTDTASQGLNSTQQSNARTNISVYSQAEIGDPTTDFAATFAAALV